MLSRQDVSSIRRDEEVGREPIWMTKRTSRPSWITSNALLSDFVFFYHKLQSYHWYISGHTFFQTHAKLEEYYDDIRPQIDEVAETMLMSGYRPVSTMAVFAKHAKVKDATEGFVGDVKAVYASILGDFKHLLESVKAFRF